MSERAGLSDDLRAFLEASKLGVVVHGAQDVVHVSEEASRLLGYPPSALRTVADVGAKLFGEEMGRSALCRAVEHAQTHGVAPAPVSIRVKGGDGQHRHLRVMPPIALASGLIVQTLQDATELAELEAEHARLEASFQAVLESAADFVVYRLRVVSEDHHAEVDMVSPSLTSVLGAAADAPFERWFEHIHPEDAERVRDANADAARSSRRFSEIMRVWHPDRDEWRWVHAISNPVRDEAGAVTHFAGVIVDVTAQQRSEEERRRLEIELTRKHRLEALGTLAGGVAHEFNNLLMAMQGTVALGLEDAHESERAHGYFQELQELVQGAAVLTRELLGYARRGRYEVRPFEVAALLDDVTRALGRSHPGVSFEVRLGPEPRVVRGDRGQLERVFHNLLMNAADASGGGAIRVEARDREVGPGEEVAAGAYVELAVVDQGRGMDEATRQRVFEPFFTTKPMGGGRGLGLAAAHGIVRGHGGTIVAESALGEGTTMRVLLPRSREKPDRRRRPGAEEAPARSVLIVDDEKVVRTVVRRLLERAGYRVFEANGVESGVSAYFTHQPDGVVLDLVMPKGGGRAAFERIRARDPEARVLLASGYSVDPEVEALIAQGALFLEKPFTPKALREKLSELFQIETTLKSG